MPAQAPSTGCLSLGIIISTPLPHIGARRDAEDLVALATLCPLILPFDLIPKPLGILAHPANFIGVPVGQENTSGWIPIAWFRVALGPLNVVLVLRIFSSSSFLVIF